MKTFRVMEKITLFSFYGDVEDENLDVIWTGESDPGPFYRVPGRGTVGNGHSSSAWVEEMVGGQWLRHRDL